MHLPRPISDSANEKRSERWFLALYLTAWIAGMVDPAAGTIAFGVVGYVLARNMGFNRNSSLRDGGLVLLAQCLLIGPGLYGCWTKYSRDSESRRFHAYLAQHECKHAGYKVVGITAGGCDRAGNCDEGGEEVEEAQYFCRATGRTITLSLFRKDNYGD